MTPEALFPDGGFPPPPHDPRERRWLLDLGPWEVRAFGEEDPRRFYLAVRGMFHLQLWHPRAGVSVLTPSRLTAGRFEAFPVRGWKAGLQGYEPFREMLWREKRVALPSISRMASLEYWFVQRTEREALLAVRPELAGGA